VAECVLFYSYSDALKGRHMIASSAEENNTAREVVEANLDNLNAMVRDANRYNSDEHNRTIGVLSASPEVEVRCRCRQIWLTRTEYYYGA
jgi:superfamily II DNA helicase RecQ